MSNACTFSCLGLAGSSSSGKSAPDLKILSALIAGVITVSSHAGRVTSGLRSACLSDDQHKLVYKGTRSADDAPMQGVMSAVAHFNTSCVRLTGQVK